MNNEIKNFFYPKTICVAGASTKEKSIGYELLKSILNYNYTGKIFPVNPKAESVLGLPCYKSISEIKEKIDLAIVMVPKQFAETTIDELIAKNVSSVIMITAGFKEIGKEGEEMEKRLLAKVKNAGMRMVGPNCMGAINTFPEIKLNATFVAEKPENGVTGFLSQSGALGAAVLNSLRETDIRFGHFVSVGNKADINENDILHYWNEEEQIKTLTFYLESFVNGQDFIQPFIEEKITKPVLILKAGKTSAGMKAASSHTGALAVSDKIVDSILTQFGIIRVNDLNELFNSAKGFENFPVPTGNRTAVITNAGGPAILAVDALEKEGLQLAQFTEETKQKIKEIIHPEGSANNPVDMLPGATAELYKKVNELCAADPNVDSVVSIFVEPVMVPAMPVIEGINSIETEKTILQVVMPLPEFWDKYRKESLYKKPLFRNPEDPSEVLSNMLFSKKMMEKKSRLKTVADNSFRFETEEGFLSQKEVNLIADKFNLPVVKNLIIKPDQLLSIDDSLFPLVLKGLSKDVIHKSEFNAVILNIKSKEDLLTSAKKMEEDFNNKNVTVEEYLIQPFIETKHEILLGGFRDSSFGPLIMFGTGGKYVEVYEDTVMRSAYLSDDDIESMINLTKAGIILKGVRGESSANIASLKNIISSAAQMMLDNQHITEFDMNPLIVSQSGNFFAVDIRIKIG